MYKRQKYGAAVVGVSIMIIVVNSTEYDDFVRQSVALPCFIAPIVNKTSKTQLSQRKSAATISSSFYTTKWSQSRICDLDILYFAALLFYNRLPL